MFEGLVDSIDVEVYNRKVEMLKDTWSKLDADRGKVFHQWFMKYEYHIIKDTMLKKRQGLAVLLYSFQQMQVNVLMPF